MRAAALRRGFAIALVVGATTLVATGPAVGLGTDDIDVPFTFDSPNTMTIEYGQYWGFSARTDEDGQVGYDATTSVSVSGATSYTPSMYIEPNIYHKVRASVSASDTVRPLDAGSYEITVKVTGGTDGTNTYHATTSPPAKLTVTPAQLGTEVRALSDPSNENNTIVTVRFTGRFVDEYSPSSFPGGALSPAGSWKLTLTDAEGTVALTKTIDRAAGDDQLASSFYWTDAKPGAVYTVAAAFTPSGASTSNFHVTPATAFTYTASDFARPVPSSTATAAPVDTLPDAAPLSLPLWLLVVLGIVIAGLITLVIVFAVKLRSTRAAGEAERDAEK